MKITCEDAGATLKCKNCGFKHRCPDSNVMPESNTTVRKPEIHRLKTLQPFFNDIKENRKTFELRLNDRDFQVGDTVILHEFTGEQVIGNGIIRKIKYVLKDCPEFGLMPGYCIFGW